MHWYVYSHGRLSSLDWLSWLACSLLVIFDHSVVITHKAWTAYGFKEVDIPRLPVLLHL